MEPLDYYAELAQKLTAAQFEARFPIHFLLKMPSKARAHQGPITFRTQAIAVGDALISDTVAFAREYWVWPLQKRPGNPFPDRISIGRATNCDAVFRLPQVSKLHAHIYVDEPMRIVDLGSSNGTKINGRTLVAQQETPLHTGDILTLGALDLHVLDARDFQKTLRQLLMHPS